MKILQIHDYPPIEGGGVEVNVFKTSVELVKCGHSVTIATSRFVSETYQQLTLEGIADGVEIVYLKSLEMLEELINSSDIVNINFTFSCRPASMLALEYCALKKKKCVFTIHTNYKHIPFSSLENLTPLERDEKLQRLKQYLVYENIAISAPSNSVYESLEHLGIKKDVCIIPYGLRVFDYTQAQTSIKQVDITYVGEISFLKGINYLIDAARIVQQKIPNLSVRLIGGGSDMVEMQQIVKFYDLRFIDFVGYVKNGKIFDYLNSTKIYVHPALTEMWPNAVLEALGSSVPTICSNAGGLPELVQYGRFAHIVNMGNAKELGDAIYKYINSSKKYDELKTKAVLASKFIKSNYTIQMQVNKMLELFSKLYLQTPSPQKPAPVSCAYC